HAQVNEQGVARQVKDEVLAAPPQLRDRLAVNALRKLLRGKLVQVARPVQLHAADGAAHARLAQLAHARFNFGQLWHAAPASGAAARCAGQLHKVAQQLRSLLLQLRGGSSHHKLQRFPPRGVWRGQIH
ncbi:MAG: hypothetical protein RLY92_123, partial [Chloroflexota bacterium]